MRELWAELSASMRLLRVNAGMSLRQAELASGWGRGTLSQVENGKARPGRDLVEWYEQRFHGDGLLLSLYAEARGARGPLTSLRAGPPNVLDGDALIVEAPLLPAGELVPTGAEIVAGWTFHNTGPVSWEQRRLQRIGAHAAVRLIASPPFVPIPDCGPGERVDVRVPIRIPEVASTFAAHWTVVDESGRSCFNPPVVVRVVVTASP